METRVGDSDVRELIPSTNIKNLTPAITLANLLTDRLAASDCGADLTDSELESIELMLSLHYAAIFDPKLNLNSEKFEDYQQMYNRGSTKTQDGIMSTQYGQSANTLANGCLVELDKREVSFDTLGGLHYSDEHV